MYCISDDDYFKDFNMMLNGNIIDCFNEIKEIGTIVKEEIDRSNVISNTTSSDKDLNSDGDLNKKLNKKIILENNIIYNDRWRYKETRNNNNVREIEVIRDSIYQSNRISESKCKLFKKDKFRDLQSFKS